MTICHKCKARTIQASLGPGHGFVYVDEQSVLDPEYVLSKTPYGWSAYVAEDDHVTGYAAHVCIEQVAS